MPTRFSMLFMKTTLYMGFLSTFFASSLFAQSPLPNTPVSVEEAIRNKMYIGGQDEEPIKVQETLFIPWKSINVEQIQREVMSEVQEGEDAQEMQSPLPEDGAEEN